MDLVRAMPIRLTMDFMAVSSYGRTTKSSGEVEIRRGAAGVIGRLCVIGSKIHEDALKALFTE